MKDLLLTTDNDFLFEKGDFVVEHSDSQHVGLLLSSSPGEWRHNTLVGIGLYEELNNETGAAQIRHKIEEQVALDGGSITDLQFESTSIKVEASYGS